jgi:hypothetical protein
LAPPWGPRRLDFVIRAGSFKFSATRSANFAAAKSSSQIASTEFEININDHIHHHHLQRFAVKKSLPSRKSMRMQHRFDDSSDQDITSPGRFFFRRFVGTLLNLFSAALQAWLFMLNSPRSIASAALRGRGKGYKPSWSQRKNLGEESHHGSEFQGSAVYEYISLDWRRISRRIGFKEKRLQSIKDIQIKFQEATWSKS